MGSIPVFKNLVQPTRFPYGIPDMCLKAAGVADALPVGTYAVFVTTAQVDAMTLALPKVGVYAPAPQGNFSSLGDPNDDGSFITVVCTTAFAHTITTPANGVNGSKHLITFTAAVANFVDLIAFNGSWWVVGTLNGTVT